MFDGLDEVADDQQEKLLVNGLMNKLLNIKKPVFLLHLVPLVIILRQLKTLIQF